jgi:hypothetical protein
MMRRCVDDGKCVMWVDCCSLRCAVWEIYSTDDYVEQLTL